ncbi:hypothetical protein FORMB_25230 [Formosa sp. Hel1_33_131]|uniref:DUF6046 domain-containing protein n=1 Tax=Formosa sp. Hel1_33_131 TaxID=1336794 RepID=UPI00084E3635|nr:DUF6046 domain-containing protein [Formosa sp. Hel1_33_131]AOR29540.1 hypothetical protein FORMB_25230 [Formosa sp. Hel1_33_131]
MNTNFDIATLLSKAFGVNTANFVLPNDAPQNGDASYTSIPVKEKKEAKKMSWLGTPIIYPTVFKGSTYQYYKETGIIDDQALNDFNIPPATLIDFRRAKNITKTKILGSNGTVKEIYGFDDWQIRFRGLCLDTPQVSAYEQHQELLKWENIADSIEVIGELFLDKSIYRLVIEDINFPQLEGKQNIIPFEIAAVSDAPLELIL